MVSSNRSQEREAMNYTRRRQVKKVIIRLEACIKTLDRIERIEGDAIVWCNTMDNVEAKLARDLAGIGLAVGDVRSGIDELYDFIGEENPDKEV